MSSLTSPATKASNVPQTSPINLKSDPKSIPMDDECPDKSLYNVFWSSESHKWISERKNYSDIQIMITKPEHAAVAGALRKTQFDISPKRQTTKWLIEGIHRWIFVNHCSNVVTYAEQDQFATFVWHHMRQKQRDNNTQIKENKRSKALQCAKNQLKHHYIEYPDQSKSDDELIRLFNQLGSWHSVVSGEQRHIAGLKRHEKEKQLIETKFCGDVEAYNRWKRLNEKLSLESVRDVSPQLMDKFAMWFEANPDFLYPGSRCIAVERAQHRISQTHFSTPPPSNPDVYRVSPEHMLSAIKSLMDLEAVSKMWVTLKFDRSPPQFTMTDKYPLMTMHGCARLVSGQRHVVVAVHDNKLVFNTYNNIIKRLPDEYHKSFSGMCERDGLFKSVRVNKVYDCDPNIINKVEFITRDRCVALLTTNAAGKAFDAREWLEKPNTAFVSNIRHEAASKKEAAKQARVAAARSPKPPSPGGKNLVKELVELSKLFQEGLLTEIEYKTAKARLI